MGISTQNRLAVARFFAVLVVAFGIAAVSGIGRAGAAAPKSRSFDPFGHLTVPTTMERGGPARTGEEPGPGPDGTPKERWQLAVNDLVFASAVIDDGVAYASSMDDFLYAIDTTTGEQLWRFANHASFAA